MVRGTGTCEAYSRAYEKLLTAVGVESKLVTSADLHMWSAVKMDGKWYQVDVTWDDPGYASADNHIYFGLTDELMTLVHPNHAP